MLSALKPGHRVSIVTFVTVLVVLGSLHLFGFSFKVIGTAYDLHSISTKISELEYKAETWSNRLNPRENYDEQIQELYNRRNALYNSEDSIVRFLVSSTGTQDTEAIKQNRENRNLLIASSIVLVLLLGVVNIGLVLIFIATIFFYVQGKILKHRRRKQKTMRRY